jgi:hypothetical protein
LKTETLKGRHVSARFRPDDWKILKSPKEFIGFLDQVYETMAELTANHPPMELRGYENLGAWGTAGMDGINIDWTCIPPFMNDFNTGKIEFDEKGDRKNAEITIFTLKGGKVEPVAVVQGGKSMKMDEFMAAAGAAAAPAPAAAPAAAPAPAAAAPAPAPAAAAAAPAPEAKKADEKK